MPLSIEIRDVATVTGLLATAIGSYGYVRHEIKSLWKAYNTLNVWRDSHVITEIAAKEDVYKRVHDLETGLSVKHEQFNEIIRRLDVIDKKIDKLEG